jgi:hypothetical protein
VGVGDRSMFHSNADGRASLTRSIAVSRKRLSVGTKSIDAVVTIKIQTLFTVDSISSRSL